MGQETPVQKALRDLFAQDDPPGAEVQRQAVLDACGGDVEKLRQAIAADTAYEAMKPGWKSYKTTVKKGAGDKAEDVSIQYVVRVPRGYTPEKSWPLLIAAHGQTGHGRQMGAWMEGLLGADREKYIIVAPTIPDPHNPGAGKPRTYNGKSYQEQTFLKPLALMRRKLNVDDDRIYVSGYSLGGHTSWHLPTVFPHLFSAALPMAGVPQFEGFPYTVTCYMTNLQHTPVWSIWGELDRTGTAMGQPDFNQMAADKLKELKNPHFRGTELKGVGHGGCFPKSGEMAKFFAEHSRQPPPESITHNFHHARHGRGFYLEATKLLGTPIDFSKPQNVRLKVSRKPGPMTDRQKLELVIPHYEKQLYRFEAKLIRKTNLLTIRPRRVKTMRLYVCEGLFDPEKPAVVKFSSSTWRGTIPPSAECILKHYAETRDAQVLILNELDLPKTGKTPLRYPVKIDKPK